MKCPSCKKSGMEFDEDINRWYCNNCLQDIEEEYCIKEEEEK